MYYQNGGNKMKANIQTI